MNAQKIRLLSILNLVFFILAFSVSNLSQFNLISENNIADVSYKYNSLFAPAGLTFAIWGLIYISLFMFCIVHLYKAFKALVENVFNENTLAMSWFFIINNLAATFWVFAWLNEYLLISVLLMIIQLVTLIVINIKLHLYNPHTGWDVKLITQMPMSIYFGWICVATIANISAWLVSINWDGGGVSPELWTVILIGIATLITLFIIFVRRNLFFAAVIIWALYGIIVKNRSLDQDFTKSIQQAAITGIAIIILAIIIQGINNIKLSKIEAKTPYIT